MNANLRKLRNSIAQCVNKPVCHMMHTSNTFASIAPALRFALSSQQGMWRRPGPVPLPAHKSQRTSESTGGGSQARGGNTGSRGSKQTGKGNKKGVKFGKAPPTELQELYNAVSICMKGIMEAKRDVRELQGLTGQRTTVFEADSDMVKAGEEELKLFYTAVKNEKQAAKAEERAPADCGTPAAAILVGITQFATKLTSNNLIGEDKAIFEKHQKVAGEFLEAVEVDSTLPTVLAGVMRFQKAFGGKKKLVFKIQQGGWEKGNLLVQALHFFMSGSGGSIKSGKPPMSALERVIQGLLDPTDEDMD